VPTRIHVTTESLQLSAATWDAVSTIVQQGSSNWYSASGAALNAANNFTQTNFLPLSGGTLTGQLNVTSNISATQTVFSSGAPVVVSSSTFETPTTGISAISNIVALSQASYNALTVKLPTTLYVIV
jgi:hypothetical protein